MSFRQKDNSYYLEIFIYTKEQRAPEMVTTWIDIWCIFFLFKYLQKTMDFLNKNNDNLVRVLFLYIKENYMTRTIWHIDKIWQYDKFQKRINVSILL